MFPLPLGEGFVMGVLKFPSPLGGETTDFEDVLVCCRNEIGRYSRNSNIRLVRKDKKGE